jgi:hypothetical protein
MKKVTFTGLSLAFLILSCSSGKKTSANSQNSSDSTVIVKSSINTAGDGKSFETAIVIQETTETEGVSAEYQWLRDHKTGYKVVRQTLANHHRKPYDILTVEYIDKTQEDFYFDISKFFK